MVELLQDKKEESVAKQAAVEKNTPLPFPQKLGFRLYRFWMEYGLNPLEYRVVNRESRRALDHFMSDIEQGKASPHPLVGERWTTFGEFHTLPTGSENLPRTGPMVVVANHYNRGRLKGSWQSSVMAYEIARAIENGFGRRYRFTIEDRKHLLDRIKFLKKHYHHFTKPIMAKVAEVADLIVTETGFKEIMGTIRQGNVLGIYPEAEDSEEMRPIDLRAASFIRWISSRAPIVPVGAWFEKADLLYRVNIGQPTFYHREQTENEVAEDIGLRIAQLLPQDLRGYYGAKLEQISDAGLFENLPKGVRTLLSQRLELPDLSGV